MRQGAGVACTPPPRHAKRTRAAPPTAPARTLPPPCLHCSCSGCGKGDGVCGAPLDEFVTVAEEW